jgi:hypothetical protein
MSIELVLGAFAALVALIIGAFARGSKAGKDSAAADAARRRSQAEEKGNAAARDAGRDGADKRLRSGDF